MVKTKIYITTTREDIPVFINCFNFNPPLTRNLDCAMTTPNVWMVCTFILASMVIALVVSLHITYFEDITVVLDAGQLTRHKENDNEVCKHPMTEFIYIVRNNDILNMCVYFLVFGALHIFFWGKYQDDKCVRNKKHNFFVLQCEESTRLDNHLKIDSLDNNGFRGGRSLSSSLPNDWHYHKYESTITQDENGNVGRDMVNSPIQNSSRIQCDDGKHNSPLKRGPISKVDPLDGSSTSQDSQFINSTVGDPESKFVGMDFSDDENENVEIKEVIRNTINRCDGTMKLAVSKNIAPKSYDDEDNFSINTVTDGSITDNLIFSDGEIEAE